MEFGGLEKFTLIDYPGKTAAMVYTIGCNFRCPYCHNPELVDETVERKFSEEEIISFLETRVGLLDGIVITGGEPTLHGDDLYNFIKRVKKLGFLVKLDSNGTNPEFLRKVIDEKLVDYIAMDVKSPIDTYHIVAGRPVNKEGIRKSIEILKENKVDYEFRTTIIKCLTSPEDLKKIAKDIKGAKKYYLQKFIPTKILNPQFKRKTTYTDEEFLKLWNMASEYVGFCGIR